MGLSKKGLFGGKGTIIILLLVFKANSLGNLAWGNFWANFARVFLTSKKGLPNFKEGLRHFQIGRKVKLIWGNSLGFPISLFGGLNQGLGAFTKGIFN